MPEREYKRLTRARRRPGFAAVVSSHSSLWLGKDHLLCIDTNGYSENYKRFYFRDIQAVTIRKTKRKFVWNWVLGTFTAICLAAWASDLLSSVNNWSPVAVVTGTIITLLFAVPLLINNLLGPTCICHLQTAVQTELLPSLSRIRRTQKMLNRIRPLIEEVQGPLAPEEIPARMRELVSSADPMQSPASGVRPMRAPSAPPVIQPIRNYKGGLHAVLFWLLLADLPLTVAAVVVESGWLDGASMIVLLAAGGLNIACLIRQHRTNLPDVLKRIAWITLVSTVFFLFIAFGYGFYLVLANQDTTGPAFTPLGNPVVLVMTAVSTATWTILGVLGLIHLQRHRRSSAGAESSLAANPDPTV